MRRREDEAPCELCGCRRCALGQLFECGRGLHRSSERLRVRLDLRTDEICVLDVETSKSALDRRARRGGTAALEGARDRARIE